MGMLITFVTDNFFFLHKFIIPIDLDSTVYVPEYFRIDTAALGKFPRIVYYRDCMYRLFKSFAFSMEHHFFWENSFRPSATSYTYYTQQHLTMHWVDWSDLFAFYI